MAFLRAENRFLSRAPLRANEGRIEGTRARHIPVLDLPGSRWRLSGSRTKTAPLLIRCAVILSRLARPPPRLAACLGLSCPLVRGGARVPPGTRLFARRVSPTSWTGCFFARCEKFFAPGSPLSRCPLNHPKTGLFALGAQVWTQYAGKLSN